MARKLKLKILPLEERILLDAAIAAVVAHPVASSDSHSSGDAATAAPAQAPDSRTTAGSSAASQPIIYVNANATGSVHDGKSWATAYTSLQDALNQAQATPGGDQIWVAEGTYVPSQVYSPDGVVGGASGLDVSQLKTFDIPNNTSIYGGFLPGMTSLSQANPTLYPTILSGDQLGNDINNPSDPGYAASKADNSWHVVTIGDDVTQSGANVTLSGLTIMDGYADGPAGTPTFGAFVYNHNFGGGVYVSFGSNVTMTNDTIEDNYAASDGGGIFSNNDNITVSNSTFLNNSAVTRGGGLEFLNTYEGTTSHTGNVINDFFENNSSSVFGGAIVGEGTFPNLDSSINVTGSTFTQNTAPEGAAITIDSLTANVNSSSFIHNVATVDGGAIATTNIVDSIVGGPNSFVTTVNNSSFLNNVAEGNVADHTALNDFLGAGLGLDFARGGGAITTYVNGHLAVNNSLFTDNVAESGDGGAILNGDSSGDNVFGTGLTSDNATSVVTGSTFIGNRALDGNGGAVASDTDGVLAPNPSDTSLTMKNSLLIGNQASGNGGGIYADTSVLTDKGNIFAFNNANLGDDLDASNAILNGHASNAAGTYANQVLNNKFLLLDNDDLYLA